MKNIKFLFACLSFTALFFTLPLQAKRLTVNELKGIQARTQSGSFAGRAQWNALTYYLQGVVEGVGAYQEGLGSSDLPPLFCPPKGKSYSIKEMMTLFEQSSSADKSRPASVVLVEMYRRKYPCKK